ncbi:MAG: class I SAM-dependent methyltransferase [Candidatus Sericytochromatia bacterium]|nr:class I SAM-dependent methyltransferase [Candidatus Sericytochromatia bacterium]
MENTHLSGASPSEIQAHYDVSNDFYQLWLDPQLIYSAALWNETEPEASLEQAQYQKLAYHLQQAQAQKAEYVLDIGCGWGALLSEVLKQPNIQQAVGLTLSQAQKDYFEAQPNLQSTPQAQEQAEVQAEVRLESWENYHPARPLDAVISIGAFEHFARPGMSPSEKQAAYTAFFQRVCEWLRPEGRLSLQTIGYGPISEAMKVKLSGLNQAVFPGSELPTLLELLAAADPFLELLQMRNDRHDYAKTCQLWRKNLRAAKATIEAQYGPALYKRYNEYLMASEMGFRLGHLHLYRLTFQKGKGLPS